MMKRAYKTLAKDKETGERVFIQRECTSKREFVTMLRRNGYEVSEMKTKEAQLYDWILANTNGEKWDWRKNRSVPK